RGPHRDDDIYVTRGDELSGTDHSERPLAVARLGEHDELEVRREPARLAHPRPENRGGRDDEGRAALRAVREERQGLNRFAEAHVVREAGAEAGLGEAREEDEALLLVVAELRAEPGRRIDLGRERLFERAEALLGGAVELARADVLGDLGEPREEERARLDHAVSV